MSEPLYGTALPQSFKGIAVFTPGGDLIYCVDPHKQNHWHVQLCAALQELLGLPEPPHFLIPCYTATIDCWEDSKTQKLRVVAEASRLVLRHQALLNAVFGQEDLVWQSARLQAEVCDAQVLATYQDQFPELWQNHELVVQYAKASSRLKMPHHHNVALTWSPQPQPSSNHGCVLRLFVAGDSPSTEYVLQNLHRLLETSLQQPYTLKIIDVHKHPEQAELDQVTATPTLVRVWPKPIKRIVGDLSNVHQILQLIQSGWETHRDRRDD